MLLHCLEAWTIGWLVYEIVSVVLMYDWLITFWLIYMPVRFFIWPGLLVLTLRDLWLALHEPNVKCHFWWRNS